MENSVSARPFTLGLSPALRFAIVTVAGSVLTALAAHAQVKLLWTPVPVTLQTLAVLGVAVYGSRFAHPAAAVASQLIYLLLGIAGLPVFALGIGATLGYAMAFPAAAAIASLAVRKHMPFTGRVLALAAASVVVMASGSLWLAWNTGASFQEAVAYGVTPFVLVEGAKVALTSLTLLRAQ